MEDEQEGANVVAAVATMSASGTQGGGRILGDMVQEAMTKAVEDAIAEGVSVYDAEEILKRKEAARLAVEEEYHRQADERADA